MLTTSAKRFLLFPLLLVFAIVFTDRAHAEERLRVDIDCNHGAFPNSATNTGDQITVIAWSDGVQIARKTLEGADGNCQISDATVTFGPPMIDPDYISITTNGSDAFFIDEVEVSREFRTGYTYGVWTGTDPAACPYEGANTQANTFYYNVCLGIRFRWGTDDAGGGCLSRDAGDARAFGNRVSGCYESMYFDMNSWRLVNGRVTSDAYPGLPYQ